MGSINIRAMKKMILLLLAFHSGLSRGHGQEIKPDSLVLHFAFNRYDTIEESAEALHDRWKNLAKAIAMENPDSITITGFTDAAGSVGYNKILSLRRARHIAAWFNEQSAHDASFAGKIRVQAMGKQRPVSTIDSLNRRVELRFYYRFAGKAVTNAAIARGGVIDTVVTLVNIFFVQNSPELTASSRMAMPSVISSLRRYQDRNLRILGNCNSPGAVLESYDPLFILSVNRAKAIYDYLIGEGFDARKMSYKGLGNSVMKNPHPYTREQMEENMRVDVEVFKK
jgi:outer membrane protein OmpA-like peptidoglycan-associated protein